MRRNRVPSQPEGCEPPVRGVPAREDAHRRRYRLWAGHVLRRGDLQHKRTRAEPRMRGVSGRYDERWRRRRLSRRHAVRYHPRAAHMHVQNHICVQCAPGHENVAGDDASGSDTQCDVVRCSANQRVQNHVCTACPAGTTNAAGDDASGADTQCDPIICTGAHARARSRVRGVHRREGK